MTYPNSKGHGANMGPIWGWQDLGGPHVGPMDFAIWVLIFGWEVEQKNWSEHWNGNVVILTKLSSMAALEVVNMTTFSAASKYQVNHSTNWTTHSGCLVYPSHTKVLSYNLFQTQICKLWYLHLMQLLCISLLFLYYFCQVPGRFPASYNCRNPRSSCHLATLS